MYDEEGNNPNVGIKLALYNEEGNNPNVGISWPCELLPFGQISCFNFYMPIHFWYPVYATSTFVGKDQKNLTTGPKKRKRFSIRQEFFFFLGLLFAFCTNFCAIFGT